MHAHIQKNQRKHARRKGFWRAVACLRGRSPLNCVVRDISEGGARLEFSESVQFPARFELYIEAHDRQYDCEVRHTGDYGVGVQFVGSRPSDSHEFRKFGRRAVVPGNPLDADD